MKIYKIILLFFYYHYILYSNTINENTFWKQLKTIIEEHPKIQSQVLQIGSKIESYHYTKSTYPDPKFGIMWKDYPYNKHLKFKMDKTEMSGIEYSITQPIPTPGKLNLMAKIVQKEIDIERLNLAMLYNQISKDIINLIINFHYDSEILRLSKEFKNKLILFKESSKIRYSTSSGNFAEYAQAILVEKKLEEEILIYENLIQIYEHKWKYYSNSSLYKDQEIIDSLREYIKLLYNPNQSIENEIQNSVYLNLANVFTKIEKEKIKLQGFESYPDFDLFFAYTQKKKFKNFITSEEELRNSLKSNSGENLMSFGVMFRLPLWSGISNQKKINSLEFLYKKEKENVKEIQLMLNSKIQELKLTIQTYEKNIEITQKNLLPYAELSYQSALQNYTVGKIDFENLFMFLKNWFEIQRDLIIQKKEYENKIIEYLEITNQILPEIPNSYQRIKE